MTVSQTSAQHAAMLGLRRLILAGEQFRHAVAAHFGVGLTETVAMSHLSHRGGLTPRELAGPVGLTPSAITTVLDRLEKAGLAERSPHPDDRRKVVVTVTPAGQELLDAAQGWLAEALSELDEPSQNEAAVLLTLVATALDDRTTLLRALPVRRP